MKIYLYLTEKEWVNPWINGGTIPLSLASSYLSDTRSEIYTPDENRINDMGVNIEELAPLIKISPGGGLKNATFKNNYVNGRKMPEVENGNYYQEDGIILSFSRELSKFLADKMGKKAVVKIFNIQELKLCIDEQLGAEGAMAVCEYTSGPNRNHFLKSEADAWQKEFRIFWQGLSERSVILPDGVGELVEL